MHGDALPPPWKSNQRPPHRFKHYHCFAFEKARLAFDCCRGAPELGRSMILDSMTQIQLLQREIQNWLITGFPSVSEWGWILASLFLPSPPCLAFSWYSRFSLFSWLSFSPASQGRVAPGQTYAAFLHSTNPPSAWRNNCSSGHGFGALLSLTGFHPLGIRHFNQRLSLPLSAFINPQPQQMREGPRKRKEKTRQWGSTSLCHGWRGQFMTVGGMSNMWITSAASVYKYSLPKRIFSHWYKLDRFSKGGLTCSPYQLQHSV